MTEVIIIGAGGHAAEIDEYITHSQKVTQEQELQVIGFLDDDPENYARYKLSAPLLGGVKDHRVIKAQGYVIGIAAGTITHHVLLWRLSHGLSLKARKAMQESGSGR